MRCAVQPRAVKNDVISPGRSLHGNQVVNDSGACRTRDLQPNQAIVIGADSELDGSGTLHRAHHDFCQDSAQRATVKCGPAGKRADSRVAGSNTRSFRRKRRIWCARTDGDPVRTIASSRGKYEDPSEGGTRLQLQRVAASQVIQGCLKVPAGWKRSDISGRWRIG